MENNSSASIFSLGRNTYRTMVKQSPPDEPNILTLLARFKYLDKVRSFAEEYASQCGLGSAETYQVQMAVDEAFTNIVEHAYGGECDETIECACEVTAEGLVITMRDCGVPFDPDQIPDPDLKASLQDRQIGGLGLFFIRQYMDDVEFLFDMDEEEKRACNILRMVKRKE